MKDKIDSKCHDTWELSAAKWHDMYKEQHMRANMWMRYCDYLLKYIRDNGVPLPLFIGPERKEVTCHKNG